MRVRNQNLKASRIQTFATNSPVKSTMCSRFARTQKNMCYISVALNYNQVITWVDPLVFCDETRVN